METAKQRGQSFGLVIGFVFTPEDVALLVKNGIVENKLGDSTKACTMIKNLADDVIMADEFYFTTLCENLNM
ncbi:unnamed protein product [Prunus armeniaca]